MVTASILQLSLVSEREWSILFSRVDNAQLKAFGQARSLSFTVKDILQGRTPPSPPKGLCRRTSLYSDSSSDDASDASFLFDEAPAIKCLISEPKEKED